MNNDIFNFFNERLIEKYGIDVTLTRSREQPRPTIRRGLVNIMYRMYGYHDKYISGLLNLDRSTVLDHRQKHENDYRFFPLYTEVYDFLQGASHEKQSFINTKEIQEHLKALYDEC